MEFLFDGHGKHVANFVNGQLHAPTGQNIGHYLKDHGIFIDRHGHYLGEIVQKNRFLSNRMSPHRSVNYGVYGNYGNVGNYGNPGHSGSIGMVSGYEDIPPSRFMV